LPPWTISVADGQYVVISEKTAVVHETGVSLDHSSQVVVATAATVVLGLVVVLKVHGSHAPVPDAYGVVVVVEELVVLKVHGSHAPVPDAYGVVVEELVVVVVVVPAGHVANAPEAKAAAETIPVNFILTF